MCLYEGNAVHLCEILKKKKKTLARVCLLPISHVSHLQRQPWACENMKSLAVFIPHTDTSQRSELHSKRMERPRIINRILACVSDSFWNFSQRNTLHHRLGPGFAVNIKHQHGEWIIGQLMLMELLHEWTTRLCVFNQSHVKVMPAEGDSILATDS